MELSKRQLSPWFLLALLLVVGWISFRIVGVFLNYVLLGLFVAYLTFPAYRWLRARLHNGPVAAFAMIGMLVVGVLAPIVLLSIELVREVGDIAEDVQEWDISARLDDFYAAMGLPPSAGDSGVIQTVKDNLQTQVGDWLTSIGTAFLGAFIGLFVLLYVLYYSYTNGEQFVEYIRDILPMQEAHRDLLFHEVGNVTRAVFYGTIMTAAIQAAFGMLGFWIFGISNVVFWGLIMFVLALLPIVGPPLVWGPWGAYLILNGQTGLGIGLLIYSAILVSSIDNIIRPKLIGSRAHIHPVVILIGVLGGIVVFGFAGFLLGPLVLAVFVTVLNVYRKEFAQTADQDALGA